MLRLSKKVDYGLIAMIHLASRKTGASASAKEIADAHRLPAALLAKVLQQLARSGFLAAAQGTNGGYRLARDPESISVLVVIEAIDGPVFLTSCSTSPGDCERTPGCTARRPLGKIQQDIQQLLAETSIMQMTAREGKRGPLVRIRASGAEV